MSLQNPTVEQKEFLLGLDLSKITVSGQTKESRRIISKRWRDTSEHSKGLMDFVHSYKLSKGCNICGYKKSAYSLVFHHREPNKKVLSISRCVSRCWSKKQILEEIEKCTILCRNCHGELNGKQYDEGRNTIKTQPEPRVENKKELGDEHAKVS